MQLSQLKSGSDIRGTALAGYGEEVNLTQEAVYDCVSAFALWLKNKAAKSGVLSVAVGHDSRLSSPLIKETTVGALLKSGISVFDCALTSTPSMFMMTKFPEVDCDASVMITASHHPLQKNGLKFFTRAGGLDGADIGEILSLAEKKAFTSGSGAVLKKGDFTKLYCDSLINMIRSRTGEKRPLENFKIVVDAGNGAGGFYAERILKPLGADIEGSQFLEPDGRFPNHTPNPEDKTAMGFISACVLKNKADLGIIFDTDVDRAAIVSPDGKEINRNRLIALISAVLLEEDPGAYIVTDSVTSDALKDFIVEKGGVHHRFKRGYKNVINEAVRLNAENKNAVLAIETSGHAAFKENYFLDDGAYLVSRILIKMAQLKKQGKSLMSLISDLKEPLEEAEVRLKFTGGDWKSCGASIIESLKKFGEEFYSLEPSSYEGVRVNIPSYKGFFMARMSVHDPIMPINIESYLSGGAKEIAKIFAGFLKDADGVDLEPLKKLI